MAGACIPQKLANTMNRGSARLFCFIGCLHSQKIWRCQQCILNLKECLTLFFQDLSQLYVENNPCMIFPGSCCGFLFFCIVSMSFSCLRSFSHVLQTHQKAIMCIKCSLCFRMGGWGSDQPVSHAHTRKRRVPTPVLITIIPKQVVLFFSGKSPGDFCWEKLLHYRCKAVGGGGGVEE